MVFVFIELFGRQINSAQGNDSCPGYSRRGMGDLAVGISRRIQINLREPQIFILHRSDIKSRCPAVFFFTENMIGQFGIICHPLFSPIEHLIPLAKLNGAC